VVVRDDHIWAKAGVIAIRIEAAEKERTGWYVAGSVDAIRFDAENGYTSRSASLADLGHETKFFGTDVEGAIFHGNALLASLVEEAKRIADELDSVTPL
jgi:hypothetical protein